MLVDSKASTVIGTRIEGEKTKKYFFSIEMKRKEVITNFMLSFYRWKVKCCSGSGTCLTECDFTGTSQAQVVIKDCKTEISKMGSPTTNSDSLVKG